jgi:hypothetical protein
MFFFPFLPWVRLQNVVGLKVEAAKDLTALWRCQNNQHNDIQHNDIQHNVTQHNDIQHNDI